MGKQDSVEQARLQNGDLRSSLGRRMHDGQTRQRRCTAVPELEGNSSDGDSLFVDLVWLVVTFRPSTDSSLGWTRPA